ncbi:F0F1 ATP synthase subunit delta [Niveispirillum fermenti]|uniref:F0F1 ATP synthase subunit delta n=1 Tax=Niveispirillum fermenti TaxID=1233113 RepID=UPI004041D876
MAAEGTGVSELASRYASALFDLADGQQALDQTAQDLTSVKALLAESAELRRLIGSPLLARDEQERAMDAVLVAAGVGELVRRFVGLVAKNCRLAALPGMIDGFLAELARRRGEVTARVTVARPLTDAQWAELAELLNKSEGGNVKLDVWVDPSLIGGMIVKIGSRMVDSSVRTKLNKLKLAMKGVG